MIPMSQLLISRPVLSLVLSLILFVLGIVFAALNSPAGATICILLPVLFVSIIIGCSLCCPIHEVSIDFYRKETVKTWLSDIMNMPILGFLIYAGKEGSFITKTIKLNSEYAYHLVQLLYGHRLTQYIEDRTA